MGRRKFNIGDLARVTRGQFFFYRGRVLDYDLRRRSYKVDINMVGTGWFKVNDLEMPELARNR